jgi:IS30 family transposase
LESKNSDRRSLGAWRQDEMFGGKRRKVILTLTEQLINSSQNFLFEI